MQKFVRYLPYEKSISAFFELKKFLEDHPSHKLAVSTNISPLMDRANFEIFFNDSRCILKNNSEYIIFFNQTYRSQTKLDQCIKKLKSSKLWKKIDEYKSIGVYEVRS